jgi:hypothetical protein
MPRRLGVHLQIILDYHRNSLFGTRLEAGVDPLMRTRDGGDLYYQCPGMPSDARTGAECSGGEGTNCLVI